MIGMLGRGTRRGNKRERSDEVTKKGINKEEGGDGIKERIRRRERKKSSVGKEVKKRRGATKTNRRNNNSVKSYE